MRRAALAAVLTLGLIGCAGGLNQPALGKYDVRIRSNQARAVTVYWTLANSRVATAARLPPYGSRYTKIPESLRGSSGLRVMVCIGRYGAPGARCTYASGVVMYGHHGTIITIFASPTLAAMVQG